MSKITITRNYQITIPKEIREKLNLSLGEKVSIHLEGEKIIIQKLSDEIWEDCGDFLPDNFEKILDKLRSNSTERFKRLGII
ncbi:MAG: AbrB/MazE/SpoVT family DNA-binding domain-containing protein [Candidatus Helarchaeota archaeon]